jgi:protein-S-isoprenylcysteine O-methyltransferase Ste14
LLLVGSLLLYEWARRVIRERGFHIAFSGDVPHELCDQGPYAWIRHPIYLSYIIAFLAQLIALPGFATLAIFLGNLILFSFAAVGDERSLAESPLAEGYGHYKRRTGMFVPRLRPKGDTA